MKKLIMTVMLAGLAAAALADVSFSYSGQLKNETGGPVAEKSPKITFSLYNVATGGAALWSRMIPVLLDDNGYFAVELSNSSGSAVGTETSLETVLAQNATLYIGLNVDGSSGEISPRQKLLSTPRAAFAEDVQTAKRDLTVNGAATFMSGLQIGAGTSPIAQIKTDGTIVGQALSVPKIDGSTAVGGSISATMLDAATVKQDGKVLIPKGVIVMWSGSTAPDGWALCDGNNGTPDLRGRFIVGMGKVDGKTGDNYGIGSKGGAQSVTLTTDQMPSHTHLFGQDSNLNGPGGYKIVNDLGGRGFEGKGGYQLHDFNTKATGGSQSHENRPPYYALAYIMKL